MEWMRSQILRLLQWFKSIVVNVELHLETEHKRRKYANRKAKKRFKIGASMIA